MRSLVLILVLLAACAPEPPEAPAPASPAPAPEREPDFAAPITARVEAFGRQLQKVSLLGPPDQIRAAIEREYGPHVTAALLASWLEDPASAPGRVTSSPWPDRIEVVTIDERGDGEAGVAGEIIEMTSTGEAGRKPVTMTLRLMGDAWLIASWSMEERAPGGDTDANANAAGVVEAYYAAIDAGEYERAYSLWSGDGSASGQTLEQFRSGFAETADVRVETGEPGRIEGAAGSRYVTIPVEITATTRAGETQRFSGTYTLRRSVVDGATAEQRAWRIHSASLTSSLALGMTGDGRRASASPCMAAA
ncbi:MAG: hypothetical protein ACRD2J_05595 [Thermoanaerobaculia bacterium]